MELLHPANDFHIGRVQTDFLVSFADGGGVHVGVGGVYTSAGEGDLSGVAIIFGCVCGE